MIGVQVRAPRYVLGETPVEYSDIDGFEEIVEQLQMLPDAGLWGWGTVHRSGLDTAELAVLAGRASLDAAGLAPDEVDALVLCCARFPAGVGEHGLLVAAVLAGLGLGSVPVTGVTLNRCANLLAGMQVAASMVAGGRQRTVLVITADKVAAESERITDFALFSDGAAACLVTGQVDGDTDGWAWVADAGAQDPAAQGNEISAELAREANARLFAAAGIGIGDVDVLLHHNIYEPIVTMKELQAGFGPAQLDTSNIARVGHCFAADPLINLADRAGAGTASAGELSLLASSVAGLRRCVLLRKL